MAGYRHVVSDIDVAHPASRRPAGGVVHMPRQPTVVIVGAGIAGLRAAERLRESAFGGPVIMVGEEPHKPYNRTPLSKQMLAGTARLDDLRLPSYHDLDVTWRLGTRARGVDLEKGVVLLPRGEELPYDGLIIATGVEARHMAGAPAHSQLVWPLRDLRDARAVSRRLFEGARHVAVFGTGFIGCEVASALRHRGLSVSLVGRGTSLLGNAVGPQLADIVTQLHRHHGVRMYLGRQPVAWATADDPRLGPKRRTGFRRDGVKIMLDDGTRISADVAILAIGSVPCVDWLRGSGLDVSDGVLAGPTCHALGPEGLLREVVVAGDVARWPNLLYDWTPRRVEHWITASEQGQHAADALLAGPDDARPFTPVPRFWTEQHGVRIQGTGRPGLADACIVSEGSVRDMSFVVTYTRQDIVVGAVGVNASRELLSYADMIGYPVGRRPETAAGYPSYGGQRALPPGLASVAS
jgi:NADPH-dependent 2,4-dienoyl-CoA reductase/sulfur reductase-like enzyme